MLQAFDSTLLRTRSAMPVPARRSPVQDIGLRLKAARIAAGFRTAEEQWQLSVWTRIGADEWHQMERGKQVFPLARETLVAEVLDIPLGYLHGRVSYSGEPLAPDAPLDLPPWMQLLGNDLVLRVELLRGCCLGLADGDIAAMLGRGFDVNDVRRWRNESVFDRDGAPMPIPGQMALARLKYHLVHTHGRDPAVVMPFITDLSAVEENLAAAKRKRASTEEALLRRKPRSRQTYFNQNVDLMRMRNRHEPLPQPWLMALHDLIRLIANQPDLLRKEGCFPMSMVARNLQRFLQRKNMALQDFVESLYRDTTVCGLLPLRDKLHKQLAEACRVPFCTNVVNLETLIAITVALEVSVQDLLK